jgi:hypothetical protein
MKALVAAGLAVLRHPSLWGTALAQLWRITPRDWWRRPPYLPLPDRAYLGFRLHTMYGDDRRVPEPEDVVAYLRWCRAFPRGNARPAGGVRK